MNTATLNVGMCEALVDVGVKPELARHVKRKLEAALLGAAGGVSRPSAR